MTQNLLVLTRLTLRGWRTTLDNGQRKMHRTSRFDALDTALCDIQAEASDACIGALLYGYQSWPGYPLEHVNFMSIRAVCAKHGLRVLRVPVGDAEAAIVFPDQRHRNATHDWVWHALLGRIVLNDTLFSLTGTPPQE